MRILIEEHQYEVSRIRDIMYGIDALETVEGYVSVSYVGYYYNTRLHDCVFILPKVLLKDVDGEELVFGKYRPEDIMDLTVLRQGSAQDKNPLSEQERDFIYKFSVWIYRAIVVYHKANKDNGIIYHKKIAQAGQSKNRLSNTFLDILLSLIQFNKDNRDFFMFILKNLHSGNNKINWTRTIATTNAIVQQGNPIYLNPVNKKRLINFDEELLVIFYSILYYISDHYGFSIELNCNFELITGKRFEMYLKQYGRTRLLQIKYKYFSDKALKLWKLCFAFFDNARNIYVNTELKEYLLAKNFNIVFEGIIDELIGQNPLPDGMQKRQDDGKIVDHMYTAKSLVENEDKRTYYIGDSKYYKLDTPIGRESIAKQYTYARNVIQWNLDIFGRGDVPESGIKLRDDMTEGYNIIPNFFISAKMDPGFSYQNTGIDRTDRKHNHYKSTHFSNRLFDRDTLLLFHYDVNFLYVLSLYARNNKGQKLAWRNKIRDIFTQEIQKWLQEDYDFYAMKPLPGEVAQTYFERNFQSVLGKVYSPYSIDNVYSLALDKDDADNDKLLGELRNHFQVERCTLGTDPETVLKADVEIPVTATASTLTKDDGRCILMVYVIKAEEQPFVMHTATEYAVKAIPSGNILGVKYFMPLTSRGINEYYEITGLSFAGNKLIVKFDNTKCEELGPVRRKIGFNPHSEILSIEKARDYYEGNVYLEGEESDESNSLNANIAAILNTKK